MSVIQVMQDAGKLRPNGFSVLLEPRSCRVLGFGFRARGFRWPLHRVQGGLNDYCGVQTPTSKLAYAPA